MSNIERAIAYVKKNGNAIDNNRLSSILWDEIPKPYVLEQIAQKQGNDGGFSHWTQGFSSICDTVYIITWLDDLSVHEGLLVDRAIGFLLEHQQQDGGWDEVERISNANPPQFLVPGEINTRTWLTAYCAHWFVRFNRAEPPGAKGCPVEFLLKYREPSGRLKGYLRATWDSLVLFYYHPGPQSDVFRQTLDAIEKEFNPESWEGSYLAWLLCCLRDAKLPANYPLVKSSLDFLEMKQRADGSWESEDGEEYSVDATIQALRVLKHYSRI